ncbi:HXXXD-type acyl-transferase family protein [Striga hermonthica]|uniref:HXXXD-type acyl-transferase family protein n=1 Tax=Striga hermonthica TaxID=68872 RepID=A0A9N7N2P0_STRHE|nr:HXXXD-type acyl-transferase family protein [Striga hermonthica]
MESSDFSVTMRRSEVVTAVLPVQDHWLPLSNLDLLLPPLDFGIFFCYKKIVGKDGDNINSLPVVELKKALSQVLATFYPLAGEIVHNSQGEPEILCNNRGVDFVQAYADVELKDIDLHRPEKSVHGKLVPIKMHGVLSVQLDFGWGGPEFGSYHFPWGGETGYVMPMSSARGNGDWVVYMHLKRRHLDLVEARAPHVFRPFSTVDYFD